ncbi:GHMP family kinase ATP-binding protein [Streptomyces poonensis]|uniref:GHMP kinase N-terminal domain-containing protein n=1 Tax=Streptomyces poonensis TaxID=68255 RepID=A0A918QGC4_9ACTN|nr:hypothetical protein [Streptomyces poonensis]GGZ43884.1 hypothetical protein GCM10010365_75540 [Streptomyces poonensis]
MLTLPGELRAAPGPPGPPGRTVSGVCHGTLGELYQGPLRAAPDPDIAVVSFPVDRHSWVYFTQSTRDNRSTRDTQSTRSTRSTRDTPGTPGTRESHAPGPPPLGEKSATAARLFLEHFGLTLPPGHWTTHSDLRVGVGMASSTADIVATLRCLFRLFHLPYDTDVAGRQRVPG